MECGDETTQLPEIGESLPIWFEGHIEAECVGHNADDTIRVRMPDGDVVIAENVMGNWEVSD